MKSLLIFLISIFFNFSASAIDTKASEAVIIDFNTQEILFEKNSNKKSVPASMTKIMTAYIAFDFIKNNKLSLDSQCTVSPLAYKMGGSRMFLEINDKVSINELLKGIIIQSGNDASVTIAECISGTEESFVKLMNNYSNSLSLKNTNFVNSSGWPNENHYSTVKDLAVLSNEIIRNFPDLYKLIRS